MNFSHLYPAFISSVTIFSFQKSRPVILFFGDDIPEIVRCQNQINKYGSRLAERLIKSDKLP